ncbi:VOC family protein [Flavobacterium terrisoli]|uniref:VOC family protein n=1 Tax=Flavobacterium terrisoli TaxID=3242195 RepID=UPI0025426E6A|nr:VOC family protein [Flavobacterium buctense]
MTFRYARHTNDLERIKAFYIDVLGMELLGSFENHDGYDGIFIGKPTLDWHLEFTKSDDLAKHTFDEDDILVFYPKTISEYKALIDQLAENGIKTIESKNPYWNQNGIMVLDPDGYRIIISSSKTA